MTVYPDDSTSPGANRASYPEVVVLHLHDRNGKPTVNLDTHEAGAGVPKGSGLGPHGDSDAARRLSSAPKARSAKWS